MSSKAKPRILFWILHQDGVGYYRMAEPARMINKLGLAKVTTNPFDPTGKLRHLATDFELDSKGRPKCTKWLDQMLGHPDKPNFDAIVIQRYDHIVPFSITLAIKDNYKIPILQENDDYLWDIPEMNPGILSYHEQRPENQITPNQATYISRKSLGIYDAYIVSTPFLQDLYKNYSPTYVCPNSIDFQKRNYGPAIPHGKDEIRVAFSASAGHIQNLQMVEPVMRHIMEQNKNVYFYSYKYMPKPFKGTPLEKRVRLMTWESIEKYPEYLHSLSIDIAIAPLVDRLFNRAKSNLRLLEYWTSGHYPVIASNVGEYKRTIKHGVNGLIANESDDWLNNIELLIKSASLRKKIGEAGYKTAHKDFNLETNAKLWVRAIKSTIRDYTPGRLPPDQYLPPESRGA